MNQLNNVYAVTKPIFSKAIYSNEKKRFNVMYHKRLSLWILHQHKANDNVEDQSRHTYIFHGF